MTEANPAIIRRNLTGGDARDQFSDRNKLYRMWRAKG
jgi:hypothetical protein